MYMAMGHVLRGNDVHPFVVCEKDFEVFTWSTRELTHSHVKYEDFRVALWCLLSCFCFSKLFLLLGSLEFFSPRKHLGRIT